MGLIERSFYDRDPLVVARELIGKRLVRRNREGVVSGIIVETEAYLAESDPACHSAKGMTRKNASMFGPCGHLYVYSIHARYCLNAVTEGTGIGSAVLIRSMIPDAGIELMRQRRNNCPDVDLLRGPARLCEALSVNRKLDGHDLTLGRLIWIEESDEIERLEQRIQRSPRIGISTATELNYRFFLDDSPHVSRRSAFAKKNDL